MRYYSNQYPNIHFQDAVYPDKVLEFTSGADVVVSINENTCLSYYFSLPNMLFEYIICGVPSIVSNFSVMGKFINDYQCSWKTDVADNSIVELVRQRDKSRLEEKRKNALAASEFSRWGFEASKMIKVFEELKHDLSHQR